MCHRFSRPTIQDRYLYSEYHKKCPPHISLFLKLRDISLYQYTVTVYWYSVLVQCIGTVYWYMYMYDSKQMQPYPHPSLMMTHLKRSAASHSHAHEARLLAWRRGDHEHFVWEEQSWRQGARDLVSLELMLVV